MKALHKITHDGGFVCGDQDTGITAYAYPTSEHATKAKKRADDIADEMLRAEIRMRPSIHPQVDVAGYDARNWKLINETA